MPLELSDCQFTGPALPEPFVKFELENELNKLKLLPKTTGIEGKELKEDWETYRRHLAQLAVRGGPVRVRNQAIEPLCQRLGYTGDIVSGGDVETREGRESGGHLLTGQNGDKLRIWATDLDEDLDAPAKRGQAYRFSHLRIAQRVLLASGERVGLSRLQTGRMHGAACLCQQLRGTFSAAGRPVEVDVGVGLVFRVLRIEFITGVKAQGPCRSGAKTDNAAPGAAKHFVQMANRTVQADQGGDVHGERTCHFEGKRADTGWIDATVPPVRHMNGAVQVFRWGDLRATRVRIRHWSRPS